MTDTRQALVRAIRQLEDCMHNAHKGKVCFDGDEFHETLEDCRAALAAQPEQSTEFERGRQQGMQQERALWELAKSTQEIETQTDPSAQGEPVACVTEEMVTAYLTANDAYWKRIDGEPTKLGKWRNGTPSEATRVSLMAALAVAPSTPPPAVVEAVPLTDEQIKELSYQNRGTLWPREDRSDVQVSAIPFARAIERAHGIAPKAAQPVEGER